MQYTENIAGIDIGSRSIELVVLNGGGPVHQVKAPTTFDPLAQCKRLMRDVSVGRVVATGYGRKLFADFAREMDVTTITEIQAYALGARFLFPEARTVLDIGGQDTKVISLLPNGKVGKFEMNDRCAAGTGKFLEFMATALQVPLDSFGEFALLSDKRIQINSMCTVFAGGVAHNACVSKVIEEQLEESLLIPESPDMVGALGAALYGKGLAAVA
jgi:predicted CoA-substrate-specific enzyme activase